RVAGAADPARRAIDRRVREVQNGASHSETKGDRMKGRYWVVASLALMAALAAVVVGAATNAGASTKSQKLTKVTLQLKWVTQAQFAGYYAAKAKGYYKAQGLDVRIKPGGPSIIPEQVVAGGQAEFGIDWLSSLMTSRDQGVNLVNIAQVLAAKNPKTGKLYQLKDLNVIPMQKVGTSMLEDGIFVRGDWIKSKSHQALSKKFVAASLKGWIWCRDHLRDCVKIVLANGPALPKGHQTWQMNEINALAWPSRLGIGLMDPTSYARSAKIVKTYGKLKKLPGHEAYRTDIAKGAQAILKKQHIDIYGKNWKKATVKVTPGGK